MSDGKLSVFLSLSLSLSFQRIQRRMVLVVNFFHFDFAIFDLVRVVKAMHDLR